MKTTKPRKGIGSAFVMTSSRSNFSPTHLANTRFDYSDLTILIHVQRRRYFTLEICRDTQCPSRGHLQKPP